MVFVGLITVRGDRSDKNALEDFFADDYLEKGGHSLMEASFRQQLEYWNNVQYGEYGHALQYGWQNSGKKKPKQNHTIPYIKSQKILVFTSHLIIISPFGETSIMAEWKAVMYNNAGVWCHQAGLMKIAFTFFKASLEMHLLAEKLRQELDEASSDRFKILGQSTFVAQAEGYLQNMDTLIADSTNNLGTAISSSTTTTTDPTECTSMMTQDSSLYRSPYNYKPFLFDKTFRLATDSTISSERMGAAVIFNLAVLDHERKRNSSRAMHLYQLSMTLLLAAVHHHHPRENSAPHGNDDDDELMIALTNNMGVWNFENGHIETGKNCIKWLEQACGDWLLVGGCSAIYFPPSGRRLVNLDDSILHGLRSNVIVLLHPPFWTSPAA